MHESALQSQTWQSGVIAGLNIAEYVWRVLSENVVVTRCFSDGSKVLAGDVILTIEGYARTIFAGERTALNFLCHMSGIATQTRAFVDMIAHTKARLTCTRKTLPGLRAIEKYAVHVGGGSNCRT
jgi:nicotinate-nucleotide pyrophosphorylase (carboxylating)